MPALIFVIVLAALFKLFPHVALLVPMLWFYCAYSVVDSICRLFGSCQSLPYEAGWIYLSSLFPLLLLALYFAWKWWSVAVQRRLYFNLLILAIGVPFAIALGIATSIMPEPN
jgi:hypothetical protein